MNKQHRKNLLKAADAIEGIDPEQFHMRYLRAEKNLFAQTGVSAVYSKIDPMCGTVGCALGWCVFVEGLEPKEEDYDRVTGCGFNFNKYSKRIFGLGDNMQSGLSWDYMFDSAWERIDNTPAGAANRMREIANGKKVDDEKLGKLFYGEL